MITLHAAWHDRQFLLWGEGDLDPLAPSGRHPAAVGEAALRRCGVKVSLDQPRDVVAWLPSSASAPLTGPGALEPSTRLAPWELGAFELPLLAALELLVAVGDRPDFGQARVGGDLAFWARAARLGLEWVREGAYLPIAAQDEQGFYAAWETVAVGSLAEQLALLGRAMPGAARALNDDPTQPPATSRSLVLKSFLDDLVDALARPKKPRARRTRQSNDPFMAWLEALRSSDGALHGPAKGLQHLIGQVSAWRRPVELMAPYRLGLRLEEPSELKDPWWLHATLQPCDDPSLQVGAAQIHRGEPEVDLLRRGAWDPADYLESALASAQELTDALTGATPDEFPIPLSQSGAHRFLLEAASPLAAAGFKVRLPAWWQAGRARKTSSARATVRSPGAEAQRSLDALAPIDYALALGDATVSSDELAALAAAKSSLVQFRGQWIEVDVDSLAATLETWRKAPRALRARDALRLALIDQPESSGLTAWETTGWLQGLLERLLTDASPEPIPPPTGFKGTLRPYQLRGLSWLNTLAGWGLGACLADDMGLGKTIQLLAFVLHERERGATGPVLLVAPTSVVGNWQREAARFAPDLSVWLHHGADRIKGEAFTERVTEHAIVLTSYALLQRDHAQLAAVEWRGVVFDEAQNIKNPQAKQSQVARGLHAAWRVVMTGTPVENHLGDLWSLMETLNPGWLGSQAAFRREFAGPIARGEDPQAIERLKRLTGPLILRRLKTDPALALDLPEKRELKAYCNLTREQATLYGACVEEATRAIEGSEGIQRKGIILATLTKLKQICNHPAQFLGDGSALAQRSGKLSRLGEMLEECLEEGDRALVFTQFARMGELLKQDLETRFGMEVLFLHGGVPKAQRDRMVERFQGGLEAPRIFVLSVKAGGTGLNLTAANRVFHFDRWWNPAVEDQATDRAYRIGQARDVWVHKLVCQGTLEERIDAVIEDKKALAEQVVGTGEDWLTRLSTAELRELLALRSSAWEV